MYSTYCICKSSCTYNNVQIWTWHWRRTGELHILALLGPEGEERKNYICTIEGEESGASLSLCVLPSPPLPPPLPSPPFSSLSTLLQRMGLSRPWFMDEEKPEGIQWFTEEQAYSSAYDLAALPHPLPPLPWVSSTGDTQEDWERETTWWRERGGGDGEGAKPYDGEKAWSSIDI